MTLAAKQDFEDDVFENIKHIEKNLKAKSFVACEFKHCDLTGSLFTDSRFRECRFDHCNLSLVKFDGVRLQDVSFSECKIDGVDFSACNPFMLKLGFEQSLIRRCNFSKLQLSQTAFRQSEVIECDFVGADLSGSDFTASSLKDSLFEQTNLSQADLCGARNFAVNPLINKLKETKVSFSGGIIHAKLSRGHCYRGGTPARIRMRPDSFSSGPM